MSIPSIRPIQGRDRPPRCEVITKPAMRYIEPSQCQNSACYRVGNEWMCQRHAQVTVFDAVMKQQKQGVAS